MMWRLLATLLVCDGMVLEAADWPQLLGPDRNGNVATDLKIGAVEAVEIWNRPLGAGFAGPAVATGKVVIVHRQGDDLVVQACDAATGAMFWTFRRPTDYVDSFGFDDGPRGVPAIADGRVFVHGADGRLDGIDLENGQGLWSVDTAKEYSSDSGYFGRACSPLVFGDQVIITPGGVREGKPAGVVAFAVKTGRQIWQSVEDEAGYASPLCVGKDSILCWMRNQLWLLESLTGKVKSKHPLRARMDASVNAAQPVLLPNDKVAISAGYGVGLHLLTLPDLQPLWNQENLIESHYSSPVLKGDALFGFNGRQETGQTLRCVDWKNQKVKWESEEVAGGTLLIAGDHLLVVTEAGELWIVDAIDTTFKLRQRTQILRAGHRAQIAYADGVIFARDGRQLVAVRVAK